MKTWRRWDLLHAALKCGRSLEALMKMEWQEYRIALLQKNLEAWREIEEDPQKEYIQRYAKWADCSETEAREYVRGVIRDLEESLRRAVGGEVQ